MGGVRVCLRLGFDLGKIFFGCPTRPYERFAQRAQQVTIGVKASVTTWGPRIGGGRCHGTAVSVLEENRETGGWIRGPSAPRLQPPRFPAADSIYRRGRLTGPETGARRVRNRSATLRAAGPTGSLRRCDGRIGSARRECPSHRLVWVIGGTLGISDQKKDAAVRLGSGAAPRDPDTAALACHCV